MRPCLFLFPFLIAAQGTAQTFTDVASQAGVGFGGLNTAASAWRDYDGDGDEDFFLPINGGSYQPNDILARNDGNGYFVDAAATAGVQGHSALSFQRAAAWGDYDNDGDPDLFVTNTQPYQLFQNDGFGFFADVAPAAGLASYTSGGTAALWADIDNDGWLDLFVSRWGDSNHLFHSNGNGTFTEIAGSAGVAHGTAASGGGAFADFDGDGDLDLYSCSVDTADPGRLFRNNGNLTFSDVSQSAGIAPIRSQAAIWADFDEDGDCDLYISSTGHGALTGYHYVNQGDGTFVDAGTSSGLRFLLPDQVIARGASVADFDNDGHLDVYVTCSNIYGGTTLPANRLFRGVGSGSYVDVSAASGTDCPRWAEGSSWADYDDDGDLDLFVANDYPQDCRLYRNDVTGAHWSRLRFVGTLSNQDAIGAMVRLRAGGSWQTRWINGGGTGVNCQDSLPVEFGLGFATQIEMLEISWPSGLHEVYQYLAADQEHVFTEGTGSGCPVPVNYCVGAPNSVGPGVQLAYTGSTSHAANDLWLHAGGAPPGQFSVFFYGPLQVQLPFFDGYRCVAAGGIGVFRLWPPQPIDGAGSVSRHIDCGTAPMGYGAGRIEPGDTWNFQLWYRDPSGPGGTGANASDALSVTFCF